MEITNDTFDATQRYFSVLSHMGYKPYKDVNKLLVLQFIEELLTGDMSFFITEADYNAINNALYCLYGTCMIPFPDYKRAVAEIVPRVLDEYRITESGVFRVTDTDMPRVKS